MEKLTENKIKEINSKCPYGQGVFFQPNGVPVKYKEHVVYMRYETGGYSGGSCWDDSDPQPYYTSEIPNFKALDLVLEQVCPEISYLKYKEISKLIQSNEDTDQEYYGNCTDYKTEYIVLLDLYNTLGI